MGQTEITLISIPIVIISLLVFYFIIKWAVESAMRKQNGLLSKQNDILLKMLNHQGVGKDELTDIFLMEKKDLWPSMKNKV